MKKTAVWSESVRKWNCMFMFLRQFHFPRGLSWFDFTVQIKKTGEKIKQKRKSEYVILTQLQVHVVNSLLHASQVWQSRDLAQSDLGCLPIQLHSNIQIPVRDQILYN